MSRWDAFTNDELVDLDSAFGVADSESQVGPGGALWVEILRELDRRGHAADDAYEQRERAAVYRQFDNEPTTSADTV